MHITIEQSEADIIRNMIELLYDFGVHRGNAGMYDKLIAELELVGWDIDTDSTFIGQIDMEFEK